MVCVRHRGYWLRPSHCRQALQYILRILTGGSRRGLKRKMEVVIAHSWGRVDLHALTCALAVWDFHVGLGRPLKPADRTCRSVRRLELVRGRAVAMDKPHDSFFELRYSSSRRGIP